MADAFKFDITNNIALALTRIERVRGFLDAATLSEDWIREMGERALVLEAHHTTHIEGTRLALEQSESLWAGEHVPEADPDDALELLNYRKAFDLVAGYLDSGAPITEGVIREIHKCLVEGVRGGSAGPGAYRKVQNQVVNSTTGKVTYMPPPAHDVPIMMADLVEWLNNETEIHPVLVSGIAQYRLVHIHPFLDGNGRTSRLLSTLCLYRAGYDFKRLFTISEFYDRNRKEFYEALKSVLNKNKGKNKNMNLTGWLEYFVEGLSTQLAEVQERGEHAIRRDILVKKHGLSDRQSRVLGLIIEHGSLTIQDLEQLCPDVVRRSLQRDLKVLMDHQLLTREGSTNQRIYSFHEPNS